MSKNLIFHGFLPLLMKIPLMYYNNDSIYELGLPYFFPAVPLLIHFLFL